MATKYEDGKARMAEEVEAPSERYSLNQAQLTQSGYFPGASPPLPILVLFPKHYISETLATTMQQRMDAPVATTNPASEGSQALASTSSPAC